MKYCPVCDREFEAGEQCPDDGTGLLEKKASLLEALVGTTLKNTYRIGDKIGQGGMGTVFRAEQLPLGRRVAVKVIHADEQHSDAPIKRFYREAKQLSALSHPNIVQLIDFGNTGSGLIYFVMECLEGQPLDTLVPVRRPLPAADIGRWFEQICAGVGAAHATGLVHRDLKPSNVFIARSSDGSDVVKLLDFGIAKSLDQETSNLTKTGSIVGTVGYIAPELITGDGQPSVRSDIYSLGGVLYFMLTGNQAYDGPSTRSILLKQLSAPPEPLDFERFGYPDSFKQVVLKAMAIDPAARYLTTAELGQAVRAAALATVTAPRPGPPAASTTAATSQLSATGQLTPDDIATGTLAHPAITGASSNAVTMPPLLAPAPAAPALAAPRSGSWRTGATVGAIVLASAGLAWWVVPQLRNAKPGATSAPSSQPSAATQMAAATGADNGVLVGMSASFSGVNREKARQILNGLQTALKAANERGGINGRPIEVVAMDDGYEPERARQNVRELIAEKKVAAIVGNQGTVTTEAALPVAIENRTIFFGACTGASQLEKDPPDRYVFNYRPRHTDEVAAIARYLVKTKKIAPNRIAVLAQDDSYGREGTLALQKALAALGDTAPEKIVVGTYARNSTDVAAAARAILAHRSWTDAIVLLATYQAAAHFIKAIRDAKLNPVFASISGIDADAFRVAMQEVAPDYDAGVVVSQVVPHVRSEASGVRRFREDLKKHFPQEQPSSFALEAYIAGNIFIEGLRRAGPGFTTESLVDTFEQMKEFDLGTGVACSFGPSHHQCSDKVWANVLDDKGEYQVLALD